MKTKVILSIATLLIACFTSSMAASLNRKSNHKLYKPTNSGAIKTKVKRSGSMSVADATRNLQFGFSEAALKEEYDNQLDALAIVINKGNYAVALRGHADSIGTYVGNWKLSEKRAIAVKEYLVSKGVSADKIVTTPFGSTVPIASNKTKEGRKRNRRVEIKLQPLTDAPSTAK